MSDNIEPLDDLDESDPQSIEQELVNLLQAQTVNKLRDIARRRSWKLRGTRKDDLVKQLVQHYLDDHNIVEIVETLDDERRLALEFLILRASLTPIIKSQAVKTIRQLKGRRSQREVSTILHDLQKLGLILSFQSRGGEAYRLPVAVAQRVPPWPGILVPFEDDPDQLDVRRSPDFALTQIVYQVWQYLHDSPRPKKARSLPQPTQLERQWPALKGWLNPQKELEEIKRSDNRFWYSGRQQSMSVWFFPPALTDDDLAELRRRTASTDDIITFAFNLLTSLGLLRWKYGGEIQVDRDGMATFLTHPNTRRLAVLVAGWINLHWWSEMELVLRHRKHLQLRRNIGFHSNLTYNSLVQELAQARMIALILLRRLTPGKWYRAADFRQLLRRFWPNYLHAASSAPTTYWWMETAGSDYKLSPDKAEDWEAGHGPFVTACLEGPLAWLGVVTLGYERQGLEAFQITDLGAYLLGLRESYVDAQDKPTGPALTIRDDGTVFARTGYSSTGAYEVLNAAARMEETSAQQFRYQITAATAQQAFEQGWTGQAILNELEKHSGAPVPKSFQEQILNWAQGYGQVHLYDEVTLIEFADDFALRELLASTSLAQHMVYQFSPRLIAIESDAVDILHEELVRQGHTPRIE
ncbi:MAG: hypothetical protein B6I34_02445 [Anaerolineaceae bacterium 4572_32.1]|nr:MAG: hypothetical protein B6I34_02445 [Anaerolineaceae bacterium 4572_32.1]